MAQNDPKDLKTKAMVAERDKRAQGATSLANLLRFAWEQNKASLQVCLPVKVLAVDRVNRYATVQPLPRIVTNEAGQRNAHVFTTGLRQLACGGFLIDLPVSQGDVGWVFASDRECLAAKENHDIANVSTLDTHRYNWGFFVPDSYGALEYARLDAVEDEETGVKRTERVEHNVYDGEDGRMVISTVNGKQKISLGPGDIRVYASEAKVFASRATVKTEGEVEVDAPRLTVSGSGGFKGGANGLITAMTSAVVTNGIITQIGGGAAASAPRRRLMSATPRLAASVPGSEYEGDATKFPAKTSEELADQLEKKAFDERGQCTIEEMNTEGRGKGGLSGVTDDICEWIRNYLPLEEMALKIREGKAAARKWLEEEMDKLVERVDGMFEEAAEDAGEKQAEIETLEKQPETAPSFLLKAKAATVAQATEFAASVGKIADALGDKVDQVKDVLAALAEIPDDPQS